MKQAWIIWILAASFFFFEYIARVSPSIMVASLMQTFHVGALSLGVLSGYFYYAYVTMQIPVGTLMDKFGPRRLLTMMSFLFGMSCIIFGNTDTLMYAKIARFCMGFSGAFAFVGALKLVSVWFRPTQTGFIAGATQALGMLGAALGGGPLALAVTMIGWRSAIIIIGCVILVLAILIWYVVRDQPVAETVKRQAENSHSFTIRNGLSIVLKNPLTWINGLFSGLLYAPTGAFAELWGPTYVHTVLGLSPEVAASAISMIFLGWGIGSPFFGWISDHLQQRRPILIISALCSLILMTIILYAPLHATFLIFLLMFLYGFTNIGVATAYAVSFEINPRHTAGTALGFTNMSSILVGSAFQPLIGWLLDLRWNHKIVNGIRVYSIADYHTAMLLLPVCLVFAVMLSFFIKESYGGVLMKSSGC